MRTDVVIPDFLRSLKIRPLFAIQIDVQTPIEVGHTPFGGRRVGMLAGGSFKGERLRGVLVGGMDWQTLRSNGSLTLDVRAVLKTDDGALIDFIYSGIRAGSPEILSKLGTPESLDPASYYYRIAATFETAATQYGWLNNILAVGMGHRLSGGPVYNIFEVL